jgi:glutamate/tyrosine decarboxylase-like PLP-dependent enzyme
MQIFSSGFVHASVSKAASMLGIGRQNVKTFAEDDGRLDSGALEAAIKDLNGAPCVIVANAGEVNAGEFDPIDAMADLAHEYNAWLHVDGTFGLFARLSPALKALTAGTERADSITADGHKWLNVPFDTGFCFVRDDRLLGEVFSLDGAYLNDDPDAAGMLGMRGPEMSRRARAFPVFATLAAYGREGYRELVERGVALAQELAAHVDDADDFELLAPTQLCITSFRYKPANLDGAQLDRLNTRLGEAILNDGQIYMGTTVSRGHVALKPAFVNWRTTSHEIGLILPILRELGEKLLRQDGSQCSPSRQC